MARPKSKVVSGPFFFTAPHIYVEPDPRLKLVPNPASAIIVPIVQASETALRALRLCATGDKAHSQSLALILAWDRINKLNNVMNRHFRPMGLDGKKAEWWQWGNLDAETNVLIHRLNKCVIALEHWASKSSSVVPEELLTEFEASVCQLRDDAKRIRIGRGETAMANEQKPKPHWDSKSRTLFLGSILIKRYERHPAGQQTRILDAFQNEGWQSSIDAPVSKSLEPQKQLRDTIYAMNKQITQLVFRGDGTGKRITWTHR